MKKSNTPPKRVLVKTWGCQMNVYDSERMSDILHPLGFEDTDNAEDADLVVLNTCHIREKAAEKIYSELGRLRKIKAERQANGLQTKIAVVGCVAQAEGAEILKRAPVVDLVLGPQSYHKLPEMLSGLETGGSDSARTVLATDFDVDEKFKQLPKKRVATGPTAFLTVQEGCDKFCTFCVVPYTRGAEHSRTTDEITAEARALVTSGVREITLLGQNVNAWAAAAPTGVDETWGLAQLLGHLSKIDGLDRLRYTTSHPRDMDAQLIAAHGSLPKLMPYLHLPVQSGSNRILQAMNRQHTIEEYFSKITDIRRTRPDIALSGDFIVGFPGETDQDFEDTLHCIREVGYASAYSFKYSPRPGTPGAGLDDQVPEPIKSERLQRLQALVWEQQLAFNQAQIGKMLPVLFERVGRHAGQLGGRSAYLQSVYVQAAPELIGQIVDVQIISASNNALSGQLVSA
ncbi:MAG: tRNA (N6-isopentenyl adenosine(37)-C2)-methylthiotransferase MiaB [Robiginitomaculum sp.]|nr:MAG: tRNA (N6-isopentenyl adenosine(37)-C2)-methylthiotransferase MiaB [Robiginitomaculum sp.]